MRIFPILSSWTNFANIVECHKTSIFCHRNWLNILRSLTKGKLSILFVFLFSTLHSSSSNAAARKIRKVKRYKSCIKISSKISRFTFNILLGEGKRFFISKVNRKTSTIYLYFVVLLPSSEGSLFVYSTIICTLCVKVGWDREGKFICREVCFILKRGNHYITH